MQNELTVKAPLLDERGALERRGWARHMVFDYERSAVKAPPFCLKEWDFYQISDARHVLQLTLGHVSYVSSVSANLFNLETSEKLSVGRMEPLPLKRLKMGENPEAPNVLRYEKNGLELCFDTREDCRLLTLRAHGKGEDAEISIRLSNCSPEKDKTVIATPFLKPYQFYLNYKENCFAATGYARFGGRRVDFAHDAWGLLDWGRGVWPFHQEWYWGNGSTIIAGKPFGFNIGWGFGDTSHATENMFFYDNTAVKLGEVKAERQGEGYMRVTRYTDENGLFDLTAEPVFDNDTALKVLFVNNRCHQVFSRFSGKVRLPGGQTLDIPPFTAFCEHSVNNW